MVNRKNDGSDTRASDPRPGMLTPTPHSQQRGTVQQGTGFLTYSENRNTELAVSMPPTFNGRRMVRTSGSAAAPYTPLLNVVPLPVATSWRCCMRKEEPSSTPSCSSYAVGITAPETWAHNTPPHAPQQSQHDSACGLHCGHHESGTLGPSHSVQLCGGRERCVFVDGARRVVVREPAVITAVRDHTQHRHRHSSRACYERCLCEGR